MRQTGEGVCRLRTPIACCTSPEEGSVELSLSFQERRAMLQQTVPQYREASPSQKRTLVDAFVAATGYHRTYARWLLNHAEEVQQTLQRPRPRQYGPEVQHALFLVRHAANRICAKRLIPFLPTLVESLERHEHLHLTAECRSQLLSMSASLSGSSAALPAHTGAARPLHDASRNAPEAADSHPHLRGREGVPTRLSGSGPGGPLWYRYRRRLLVHLNTHRCSHRVDGVLAPFVP
jgi:hypothetical protein